MLDGRQLALKIVANSVYGFTGALKGYLPCQADRGERHGVWQADDREDPKIGREAVHEEERIRARCPGHLRGHGFGHDQVRRHRSGRGHGAQQEAAGYVTKHFLDPINLEFEKVYSPFLLVGKKRYVGLQWMDPDHAGKMGFKGIEIVRRDRCGLVRDVMKRCLNKIFIDRDVDGGVKVVHDGVSDLLTNKTEPDMLTFTGGWGKS